MTIKEILKSNEYNSLTFDKEEIEWLNKRIKQRKDKSFGVECVVRGKNGDDYFELKPEEIIRQLTAHRLIERYGYKKEMLAFELPVIYQGKEKVSEKRIDIAIYKDVDHTVKENPIIVIEIKRPDIEDENKQYEIASSTPYEQLRSYCRQALPQVGVLYNGAKLLKFYHCSDNFDNSLSQVKFPQYGEDLQEWFENRRFTLKQLMLNDRLQKETLKEIFKKVEQRFGTNDSSDKAFDEIFKLVFTKLYDEINSASEADIIAHEVNINKVKLSDINDNDFRVMKFRLKTNESDDEIYTKINELYKKAQIKWKGVFPENSVLNMQPATVKSCVRELQNVKFFNSNLEVVDEAFEHLVNDNQKESMGQYFTPRYIIDMCVKMLNPKPNETMIDTAAGSCGFPMHTIFHVWKQLNPNIPNLFTSQKRTDEEIEYVQQNVFGLDFSEKSVRVGRMLNIIAGDGHTNVIELNSLDYDKWEKDYVKNRQWYQKYNDGFELLCRHEVNKNKNYKFFDFDIVMANPPFAGKVDNPEQLKKYDLAKNEKGDLKSLDRDVLFIERNLNFLKPGGRMAIVLPQGKFNNSSDKFIRDYIAERCRILAVVGLHGNVFKPHTGTKTSVLFVQKWDDELCPKKEDYPIFFATMQEPSKDNSGEKIYVTETYITWKSYEHFTEEIYIDKKTKAQVSAEEYKKADKKSNYKKEIKTRFIMTEHFDENGESAFIKDLFVEKYGDPKTHNTFIMKNIIFSPKKGFDANKNLTIKDYVLLNDEEAKMYKETPILGKNTNAPISEDEYKNLPQKLKKYYLKSEETHEFIERIKDTHGHIFVKHDLFNHDPDLKNPNPNNIYSKDGIAEAFIEFAKKEKLSFF